MPSIKADIPGGRSHRFNVVPRAFGGVTNTTLKGTAAAAAEPLPTVQLETPEQRHVTALLPTIQLWEATMT